MKTHWQNHSIVTFVIQILPTTCKFEYTCKELVKRSFAIAKYVIQNFHIKLTRELMQVHTGGKHMGCDICESKFSNNSILKKYEYLHWRKAIPLWYLGVKIFPKFKHEAAYETIFKWKILCHSTHWLRF